MDPLPNLLPVLIPPWDVNEERGNPMFIFFTFPVDSNYKTRLFNKHSSEMFILIRPNFVKGETHTDTLKNFFLILVTGPPREQRQKLENFTDIGSFQCTKCRSHLALFCRSKTLSSPEISKEKKEEKSRKGCFTIFKPHFSFGINIRLSYHQKHSLY